MMAEPYSPVWAVFDYVFIDCFPSLTGTFSLLGLLGPYLGLSTIHQASSSNYTFCIFNLLPSTLNHPARKPLSRNCIRTLHSRFQPAQDEKGPRRRRKLAEGQGLSGGKCILDGVPARVVESAAFECAVAFDNIRSACPPNRRPSDASESSCAQGGAF